MDALWGVFMKEPFKGKKGFTLVELIIVIAVLALLTVMSVFVFMGVQNNARRSKLMTEARGIVDNVNRINSFLTVSTHITTHAQLESYIVGNAFVYSQGGYTFSLEFESRERIEHVITFLTYNGSLWSIDLDMVANSRG